MKIVMFKNESGDDAYPVCVLDTNVSESVIRRVVCNNVGDDYCDGELYGEWWVEDLTEVPKLSLLLNK